MAQGNTEVKNSYEIGGYKSVEELASEVEKKNKDLAEKIRTNAKKQILEEGKDWRISLKEELTPDDEKALREALPDTDVQSYFNDGKTSQDESKNQNNGSVLDNIEEKGSSVMSKIENGWKDLTNGWDKKIGQLEKIWTSFSEGFDKFTDSLFSGKFTDSYKILGMIFSSGGFSLEKWEKMKKDEEDKKIGKSSEKNNEDIDLHTDKYITTFFIEYSLNEKQKSNKDNIILLGQSDKIKDMKISDLKKLKDSNDENKSLFLKEIYNNSKGSPSLKDLDAVLQIILGPSKGKNLIDSTNKDSDINNKKFSEILEGLSSELNIFGRINTVAKEDGINVSDELSNIVSQFGGDTDEGRKKRDKLEITGNIFSTITSQNIEITDINETKEKYTTGNNTLSDKERNKINEIIDFSGKIQNTIFTEDKLNLGMGDKIKDSFKKKPMTMVESMTLYTILGGKSDLNSLNSFEQTFLMLGIDKLLDGGRGDWTQGEYLAKVGDKIFTGISEGWDKINLPQGFKDFLDSLGLTLKDFTIKKINSMSETAGGFATNNPKILGIIALVILCYPYTQRRTILGRFLPDFRKK